MEQIKLILSDQTYTEELILPKIVLESSCDFFKKLFGEFKESEQSEIKLTVPNVAASIEIINRLIGNESIENYIMCMDYFGLTWDHMLYHVADYNKMVEIIDRIGLTDERSKLLLDRMPLNYNIADNLSEKIKQILSSHIDKYKFIVFDLSNIILMNFSGEILDYCNDSSFYYIMNISVTGNNIYKHNIAGKINIHNHLDVYPIPNTQNNFTGYSTNIKYADNDPDYYIIDKNDKCQLKNFANSDLYIDTGCQYYNIYRFHVNEKIIVYETVKLDLRGDTNIIMMDRRNNQFYSADFYLCYLTKKRLFTYINKLNNESIGVYDLDILSLTYQPTTYQIKLFRAKNLVDSYDDKASNLASVNTKDSSKLRIMTSPDEKKLFIYDSDTIQIFDFDVKKIIKCFFLKNLLSVNFSTDSKYMITCHPHKVKIWRAVDNSYDHVKNITVPFEHFQINIDKKN